MALTVYLSSLGGCSLTLQHAHRRLAMSCPESRETGCALSTTSRIHLSKGMSRLSIVASDHAMLERSRSCSEPA